MKYRTFKHLLIELANTDESVLEQEVMMFIHGTLRPIKEIRSYEVPQSYSERAREDKPKKVLIIK